MDSFFRSQTFLEHRQCGTAFHKYLAVALLFLQFGFSAEVFAQSIKLGYAALSAGQVAVWMAKEGGYLSKYGIEAELIYIPAVAATQALIAGEIQLAQVTGVSTSGAILAGADVRIVASSLNRIVGSIYARPEIKTPEDLKGKKLGISRFGALSETAVGIFLERHGLKRGTDVAILQLGGLPEIITAMEKGSIEAGFASPPQFEPGETAGHERAFRYRHAGHRAAADLCHGHYQISARAPPGRQILCSSVCRGSASFCDRPGIFHSGDEKVFACR